MKTQKISLDKLKKDMWIRWRNDDYARERVIETSRIEDLHPPQILTGYMGKTIKSIWCESPNGYGHVPVDNIIEIIELRSN